MFWLLTQHFRLLTCHHICNVMCNYTYIILPAYIYLNPLQLSCQWICLYTQLWFCFFCLFSSFLCMLNIIWVTLHLLFSWFVSQPILILSEHDLGVERGKYYLYFNVSMSSLIGLWTPSWPCPNYSTTWLSVLLSTVAGSSVRVVQDMWLGFLLGHTGFPCRWGTTAYTLIMGAHIWSQRGCISFILIPFLWVLGFCLA